LFATITKQNKKFKRKKSLFEVKMSNLCNMLSLVEYKFFTVAILSQVLGFLLAFDLKVSIYLNNDVGQTRYIGIFDGQY